MAEPPEMIMRLLQRMREARIASNITQDELASDLILGPGWIEHFETGRSIPDLDMLLVLIDRIGADPVSIFADLHDAAEVVNPAELSRMMRGTQDGANLVVFFPYGKFDARYTIPNATVDELDDVLLKLRDGLAQLVVAKEDTVLERQIKTASVATAFMRAVELWPHANPSDLWWFVVYRAYCDPYNHPAVHARLSFDQSWKRTGGWALEEILVRHYAPTLAERDISLEIATGRRKRKLLQQLNIGRRLIAEKVDVILSLPGDRVFGVVHVKASFAERRTDDVPLSEALVKNGYFSPLWTMDCKSVPSERPVNRGELGPAKGARSEKRIGIENEGEFSACFSYNTNTQPTAPSAGRTAEIIVCDFNNPRDAFVEAVVAAAQRLS